MDEEYQSWLEFRRTCPLVYPNLEASVIVCATRDRETVQAGFVMAEVEHAMKQEHDCTFADCHEWKKGNKT